ncbi:MAG: hypothetical protein MUF49_14840 [Oculatellaceae cyanobacterium Prado106]|nr:hypothetical protein [Oculatellaceae cyanobacterium Prado106]
MEQRATQQSTGKDVSGSQHFSLQGRAFHALFHANDFHANALLIDSLTRIFGVVDRGDELCGCCIATQLIAES